MFVIVDKPAERSVIISMTVIISKLFFAAIKEENRNKNEEKQMHDASAQADNFTLASYGIAWYNMNRCLI